MFNYECETTRAWGENKSDVVSGSFQDYEVEFPTDPARGLVLALD